MNRPRDHPKMQIARHLCGRKAQANRKQNASKLLSTEQSACKSIAHYTLLCKVWALRGSHPSAKLKKWR